MLAAALAAKHSFAHTAAELAPQAQRLVSFAHCSNKVRGVAHIQSMQLRHLASATSGNQHWCRKLSGGLPAQGPPTLARHSLLNTLPLVFPHTGLRAAEQVQEFELAVELPGLVVLVVVEPPPGFTVPAPPPVLPPAGLAGGGRGSAALQSAAHLAAVRPPHAQRTS